MPYEFTQEGFRKFSEDIVAAKGDQATVTTLLADMQDTFNDNIGALATAKQSNEGLTAENTRLKSANMELFLRIGAQKEEIEKGMGKGQQIEQSTGTDDYMKSYFEKIGG